MSNEVIIKEYDKSMEADWNAFNEKAKNQLFMFDRKYMEYHSDRFMDNSLLFYYENRLVALFPANCKDYSLQSHGGLTYGGFISGFDMKQHIMDECFDKLIEYAIDNNIKKIIYKSIPYIFCKIPSEEDRYSLFRHKAVLSKREASTAISLGHQDSLPMKKGRKSSIKKAIKNNVIVQKAFSSDQYDQFFEIENEVLEKYHHTHSVHTSQEMFLLHERFPDNIHLYIAYYNGIPVAGTVLYEYAETIHTQYMASNDEGRTIGALDLVIKMIIDEYQERKKWMDFGISTENGGQILNSGLISQKESFGGRTVVYDTYEIGVS